MEHYASVRKNGEDIFILLRSNLQDTVSEKTRYKGVSCTIFYVRKEGKYKCICIQVCYVVKK